MSKRLHTFKCNCASGKLKRLFIRVAVCFMKNWRYNKSIVDCSAKRKFCIKSSIELLIQLLQFFHAFIPGTFRAECFLTQCTYRYNAKEKVNKGNRENVTWMKICVKHSAFPPASALLEAFQKQASNVCMESRRRPWLLLIFWINYSWHTHFSVYLCGMQSAFISTMHICIVFSNKGW